MSILYSDLSNLATLSEARTRMISPENVYGFAVADGIVGKGHFAGVSLAWKQNNPAYMSAPGTRHTLYRFHVLDPIRFASDLRVTMQALAHMPLEDDVSSAAYWYQTEPHRRLPELPSNELVSRP